MMASHGSLSPHSPLSLTHPYLEEAGIAAICEQHVTHNVPQYPWLRRCKVNGDGWRRHNVGVSELVAKVEVDVVTASMLEGESSEVH